MTFLIDRGYISTNPCSGAGKFYEADRAEKIWESADIAAFLESASVPLQRALMLALWTGQRQGDLLRLTWSAYDGKTIRLRQSKRKAYTPVPLGGPIRDMLDVMLGERQARSERQKAKPDSDRTPVAITILTNSRGQPWTSDGFRSYWEKAYKNAKIVGLHFHDLRGTAVTRLALSGATVPEIAAITGLSLKTVQELLDRHYLGGRLELAEAGIRKLDAVYGTGTKTTK